ncbi:MAG: potassium transporter TrkG [Ruthenibacterium sp.]
MEQIPLSALLRSKQAGSRHNPTKVIVSSFLFVILCGALLLMLPISSRDGQSCGLLGALFTATSATCVTGLIVFDTFLQFTTFGQVVIILLIQIGGLGLVTLTTFFNIMVGRRLGFKSLQLASESISLSDSSQTGRLIHVVMRVAFLCEATGALLLSFVFVPQYGAEGIFISVFISISAFCNAGFDVFGRLGAFSSLTTFASTPYVLAIVAALIVCGGLGFLVWQDLILFRKTHHLRVHTKLVLWMTGAMIVGGCIGFALLEWNNPATIGSMNVFDKISNSMFQSITSRTAGFNSVDLGATHNITKLFMVVLMFIGAAPGGTGGGIKVTTIAVLLVAVVSVIRGRQDAQVFGRKIGQKVVYKSLAIFMLSAMAVMVSSMIIFFNTGSEFNEMSSIFEAVSAFATVGLTVGVTAYMNPIAQIATMLTMLIGRVGPVSMAITLSLHHSTDENMHVVIPQADLTVG